MMQYLTEILSSLNVWNAVLIVDASVGILILLIVLLVKCIKQGLFIYEDDESDYQ